MATIYCMRCGIPFEEGARYCPSCGSPTLLGAGLSHYADEAKIVCPSCGALNERGLERCSNCDEPLVPTRSEQEGEPVVSETIMPPVGAYVPRGNSYDTEHAPTPKRTILFGGIAALLVCGALLGAGFASGLLGGNGAGADESATEEGADDAATTAVEVRESLADYSWQELSTIATELSGCASRDDALALAREYHLVDDAGAMTQSTKDVEVAGMGTYTMRLADVYHDDLTDGGKAGLSFLSVNVPLVHQMKQSDDNNGGWEGTDLRAWLNAQVLAGIDGELAACLKAVDKHTNNTGQTTSLDSVTATSDKLWIPSVVELCGPIDWYWNSNPGNSDAYNAVLSSEGSQYACFAEMGVQSTGAFEGLALPGVEGPSSWWLRSCSVSSTSCYRMVDASGDPSDWGSGVLEQGVCLGFCL